MGGKGLRSGILVKIPFIIYLFFCISIVLLNHYHRYLHNFYSRKFEQMYTSPHNLRLQTRTHETFHRKSLCASVKKINAAAQCWCKIANYLEFLPHLISWHDNSLFDSAETNTVITKPLYYLRPGPRWIATK